MPEVLFNEDDYKSLVERVVLVDQFDNVQLAHYRIQHFIQNKYGDYDSRCRIDALTGYIKDRYIYAIFRLYGELEGWDHSTVCVCDQDTDFEAIAEQAIVGFEQMIDYPLFPLWLEYVTEFPAPKFYSEIETKTAP